MDGWMLVVGLALIWTAIALLIAAIIFPRGAKFPRSNRSSVPTHDEVFAVRHPGDHDA